MHSWDDSIAWKRIPPRLTTYIKDVEEKAKDYYMKGYLGEDEYWRCGYCDYDSSYNHSAHETRRHITRVSVMSELAHRAHNSLTRVRLQARPGSKRPINNDEGQRGAERLRGVLVVARMSLCPVCAISNVRFRPSSIV